MPCSDSGKKPLPSERFSLCHRLSRSRLIVVRDGSVTEISAEQVVPGDLLLVTEGERVAADARVLEARGLEARRVGLDRRISPDRQAARAGRAVATPLAERSSMLYAGSGVARGRGQALRLCHGAGDRARRHRGPGGVGEAPPTPLNRRLARLTRQMVVIGIVLTVALGGAMLLQGEPLHTAFLVGVAVAVAAVPEGLAATVTASLALGARATCPPRGDRAAARRGRDARRDDRSSARTRPAR